MCTLFYSWKFVPVSPFPLFHVCLPPHPSNDKFVLFIYESVSVLLSFLDSTYKCNNVIFFLSDLFHLGPSMLLQMARFFK